VCVCVELCLIVCVISVFKEIKLSRSFDDTQVLYAEIFFYSSLFLTLPSSIITLLDRLSVNLLH